MLKIEEQPTKKSEEVKTAATKSEKKADNKVIVVVLLALLVIAVVVSVLIFGNQKNNQNGSQVSSDEDTAKVVTEVKKVMVLPDETPSMATVLDTTKLADQPFFAKAENGDKLLLYTGAQKAILYRPSTKQIVEVMPLIMDNNATLNSQTDSAATPSIEGTEMMP